jgi:hypothetical protein
MSGSWDFGGQVATLDHFWISFHEHLFLLSHFRLIEKSCTILAQIGSDMSGSWEFGGQVATSDQF